MRSKLPAVKGDVKFENVTFRYVGGGDPVLKNVTFEAKPGETIALLGATGSGKTSIINLLPRFYDPTEGSITIDGHDLRDVTLEFAPLADRHRASGNNFVQRNHRREHCLWQTRSHARRNSMPPQKPPPRMTSSCRSPMATTHTSANAAQPSAADKSSAWQLRAHCCSNPRILILDDSTSSVDVATESHIQEALETLMKGRTSFVIAQRISTVMNADKILVLDKGEVVAQGKHAELMEEEPIYAEIYNSQILASSKPSPRQ